MSVSSAKESGFGAVEALVVVAIVALLGLGGWFVHKNQHKATTKTTSDASVNKATAPSTAEAVTPPVSETNVNAGYLVIKEWGIKIKMEDADKLTYTMEGRPNGSPNQDSITSFVRLKLNDSVDTSDTCREFGPSVVQATVATNATKIDNYYYGFEGGYDDCGDPSIDSLRKKISSEELVLSAIVAE